MRPIYLLINLPMMAKSLVNDRWESPRVGRASIPLTPHSYRGADRNKQRVRRDRRYGFTGQVALPVTLCRVLELEYVRRTRTMFGNASFEDIDVYRANVFWGGVWQEVSVVATGTEILIGMNMLRGSSVCFDAVDEGSISIEPYDRTIR